MWWELPSNQVLSTSLQRESWGWRVYRSFGKDLVDTAGPLPMGDSPQTSRGCVSLLKSPSPPEASGVSYSLSIKCNI